MASDNTKLIEENKNLTQQLLKLQSELELYSQETYESSRHIGWLTQRLHNLECANQHRDYSIHSRDHQACQNNPTIKKNMIDLMFLPIARMLRAMARYAKKVLVTYDK